MRNGTKQWWTLGILALALIGCASSGRSGGSGPGDAAMDAGSDDAAMDACIPDCSGRECGDDGCGGSCGTCAAGQSCNAMGTCEPGTPSGPARLVINEIDYDQPGIDMAEFIELYNAGGSAATLDGLNVVLVNGSDGGTYETIALSGSLPPGGFALVAPATSMASAPVGVPVFRYMDSIQNGAPDCVKLVRASDGSLIDGVSYEGMVPGCGEGAMGAPADRTRSMGVDVEGSIARIPDGLDTDDNALDFVFTTMPTPGAPNRM